MTDSLPDIFIDKLDLKKQGVISLIGGGGKTSLMFLLAKKLADSGKKVLTTTTTKIFLPKNYVGEKWGDLENIKYGYLWWKAELQGHDICFAWGYAGQFIFLLPQFDAAVVTTAKWRVDPNEAALTEESIIELLSSYIIPFIESRID